MTARPPHPSQHAGRVWRFGDNLNTDVLAPGAYMKFGIEEIARHCLEAVEPRFAKEVQAGDVLVAGCNCGAGSSREQAPQALKYLGVAALVAESFAGLFYRNALNLGLPALACAEAKRIRAEDRLRVFGSDCSSVRRAEKQCSEDSKGNRRSGVRLALGLLETRPSVLAVQRIARAQWGPVLLIDSRALPTV